VPLALQAGGGQFQRTLEQAARGEHLRLEPALCFVSFTQACRAVLSGGYAAVLPSIAAVDLPADRFIELPLPLLKSYERVVCLAWNPRMARLRPCVDKLVRSLTAEFSKKRDQ
jgi:DNA-binding transcriptional LysR family regulator